MPGRRACGAVALALRGNLEEVSHERLRGWAFDPDRPREAVVVRVLVNGTPAGRSVANIYRGDLEAAGIGNGRHAFDIPDTEFKPPLGPCVVSVQDEATGEELPNSPARMEAALDLSGPMRQAMVALLESPGTDAELRDRAEFMARQADRLLQRLSDRRSQRVARASQRARKWRWRPEDGPEPERLAPRALVIDSTLPQAGHDAGSHALLSHMRSLLRLGFELLFAPADMRGGPGVEALGALGIACATEPWSGSVEEVMRREAGELDLVYFHKLDAAARYVGLARQYLPRARRIYCVADLHSLRLARQAQVEERPELTAHANFIRTLELTAAASCHAVITHSAVEAASLRKAVPHATIEVVPWHFPVQPTQTTFAERTGVAFIGSYSHSPNLDAALWLMDEIMPIVWQTEPGVTCTLAGSDMPAVVSEPRDVRIKAVGRVENLLELLGQVRMTVAPLAFGAGLKGKVADSLAAGVPCVCSDIAAEGYDLPAPLQSLVAADAAGLAASIVRLHGDAELFAACRKTGLAYVAGAFNELVVDAGLRRAAGLPALTPVAGSPATVAS